MIKNIIFDFGGVLLNLDYRLSYEALARLYKVETILHPRYTDILTQYEVGAFSEGSFLYRMQELADHVITERQMVDGWNAMLLDLPKARLDMLTQLRQSYNVYLLSNTNHTHLQHINRQLRTVYGIRDFGGEYFDKAYFSHEIHMRKPDAEIYRYVIEDTGIDPSETVFIDDLPENVEAAANIGLIAKRHDPNTEIDLMINVLMG